MDVACFKVHDFFQEPQEEATEGTRIKLEVQHPSHGTGPGGGVVQLSPRPGPAGLSPTLVDTGRFFFE